MMHVARSRSGRWNRTLLAAAGLLALAACGDAPAPVVAPPSCVRGALLPLPTPARVPTESPYDAAFASASATYELPDGLLRAIGYVETQWQMVAGHEEFEGMPTAHGVMALRGARLRDGARRTGATEEAVRTLPHANITAAAALLRGYADSLGVAGTSRDAWAPVVAHFAGIALPAGRDAYVRDVHAVLDGTRSAPAVGAAFAAAADPCAPPTTPPPPQPVDHQGATWRASPNFNDRMAGEGGRVQMVIIHSCEGAYNGCWSWLANAQSQVSAHYVVREDGAEITQLVREELRAWHIGASYDSTRNAGHAGRLQGIQSNHFTIGIEHGGYASQTEWPEAQLDASARLVCDVARRWGIPRDRVHIVAHGQLQPWNRTDPGANWPWADYIARIDRHCTA